MASRKVVVLRPKRSTFAVQAIASAQSATIARMTLEGLRPRSDAQILIGPRPNETDSHLKAFSTARRRPGSARKRVAGSDFRLFASACERSATYASTLGLGATHAGVEVVVISLFKTKPPHDLSAAGRAVEATSPRGLAKHLGGSARTSAKSSGDSAAFVAHPMSAKPDLAKPNLANPNLAEPILAEPILAEPILDNSIHSPQSQGS